MYFLIIIYVLLLHTFATFDHKVCEVLRKTYIESVHGPPGQNGQSPKCGTTSPNCQSDESVNKMYRTIENSTCVHKIVVDTSILILAVYSLCFTEPC